MIEIPLSNSPSQSLSVNHEDVVYDLRVLFNSRTRLWEMDIASNSVDLVSGVGLVSGVDILAAYTLNLRNLFVINLEDPIGDPTIDSMGSGAKLIVFTDAELA